jgi:methylated-DNA-protein-cysteine methyltransferase related protein
MKDFFVDVIEVVKLIPNGRVTTYGAIARYLGSPKSSRAVGWALNKVKIDSDIPAHRVVNRIGALTGEIHFSNGASMRERLIKENIIVNKDVVENMEDVFWDPLKELTF